MDSGEPLLLLLLARHAPEKRRALHPRLFTPTVRHLEREGVGLLDRTHDIVLLDVALAHLLVEGEREALPTTAVVDEGGLGLGHEPEVRPQGLALPIKAELVVTLLEGIA